MYKIAIIIPIHNTEKYLEKCLDNIINQTIGIENLQVIMVDDHSNDKSFEIMKKYSSNFENFLSIYINDEDTGAGVARNKGLEIAKGKYIMFCDSDDFYELNSCELMFSEIEKQNTDFVTFNYRNADEDGECWKEPVFDIGAYDNMKLNIMDYDKSLYLMNSSVCNKIFNREFLLNNKIHFFYDGKPAEDAYFSMHAFLVSNINKGASYNKNIVYNYRLRNKTQSSLSNNLTSEFFLSSNEAYKEIFRLFKNFNQIEYYRYYFVKNLYYILHKFIDAESLSEVEKIEILEKMRWLYELTIEFNIPIIPKSIDILIKNILEKKYQEVFDICKIIFEMKKYVSDEMKYIITEPTVELYKSISKTQIKNVPEI